MSPTTSGTTFTLSKPGFAGASPGEMATIVFYVHYPVGTDPSVVNVQLNGVDKMTCGVTTTPAPVTCSIQITSNNKGETQDI